MSPDGNGFATSWDVTLAFAADHDIRDAADNWLTTTPSDTDERVWAVDNTAPTVSISGLAASISGPVTVTFSEAVTGFTVDDVTVGNGVLSGLTGSGDEYIAVITPASNGANVALSVGAARSRITPATPVRLRPPR
ncbi:MAG: Ig-like domain-containing protein [Cyanobacteria bacterium MAG CAR1_bin_15]|nr:Ig-like domain-containing protein [Cyanobacteria bacterium MAG CAR1_bin_15]